jgi:malonate transporter and related proteins
MSTAIVLAILPIAILILLGFEMRRRGFLAEAFWPMAERLSYYVLLPALFIHGLSSADLSGVPVGGLVAALVGSTVSVALLLAVTERLFGLDGPSFTSLFQGGIRFNNYIGLTAALALFGPGALGLAAVANATIVPMVNILVVLAFARYGTGTGGLSGILRAIALNPLILGCAIGIALQVAGLTLPPGLEGAVRALGQASLPIGLLCVGAALDVKVLGSRLAPAIAASVVKLVVMPLAAILACLALGLDGRVAMIVLLFQALPTASSSYVMARLMGGDAPLMAGIVALQTLAAVVTLPAMLLLGLQLFDPAL